MGENEFQDFVKIRWSSWLGRAGVQHHGGTTPARHQPWYALAQFPVVIGNYGDAVTTGHDN